MNRLRNLDTMLKVDMVVSALAIVLCVIVCTQHPPIWFTLPLVIAQSVYLVFQIRRVIRRRREG